MVLNLIIHYEVEFRLSAENFWVMIITYDYIYQSVIFWLDTVFSFALLFSLFINFHVSARFVIYLVRILSRFYCALIKLIVFDL